LFVFEDSVIIITLMIAAVRDRLANGSMDGPPTVPTPVE